MADDNSNQNPDGGAAAAAAPEMFTLPSGAQVPRSDLDALREGFVKHEAPKTAAPTDAVAQYYASMRKAPPAEQPKTSSETGELLQLFKMSMMHQLAANAPKPPPPPRAMSVDEKLSSTDPNTWLGRDPNTSITPADRAVIVQRHAAKLTAEGFRGNVEAEANARTAREISTAFTRACGGVKVAVGATNEAAALLEAVRRGR